MWKSACEAGKMTKRVRFETPPADQDSFGAPATLWGVYGTFWASVEPLSGRDFIQAQAVQSEITHKITTRKTGITAKMRAVYDSRTFHIVSVLSPNETGATYVIMAKELVT